MRPGRRRVNRPSGALLTVLLLALLPIAGCATTSESDSLLHPQEGLASQYSPRMAGRRTASGDLYRPGALTAAHRNLPFGTKVRVTRINATGGVIAGPVVVRINDRGPFDRARLIDLSEAAARQLNMSEEIVRVRLEILELPGRQPGRRTDPAPEQTESGDHEVVSNSPPAH